jgi:flavin reductase (DIM6/NTAB) family NADH-FMN oxidoreductase RutF
MNLATAVADSTELRRMFSCFPSGVTAVCGFTGQAPAGMTANSFTSVSLAPPLISVCIANTSRTWPLLRELPVLGISVLSAAQQAACRSLAAPTGDRFAAVPWHRTGSGAVLIDGAVSWLECTVEDELPAGDHTIALLRVRAMAGEPEQPPLVFHGSRFRTLAELSPVTENAVPVEHAGGPADRRPRGLPAG